VRIELGFVSSSSSSLPCLLSLPNSQLKNSELIVRRSVRPRIANKRRRIDYLRRKLEGWLRRRRIGDERRRQNRGRRRRKNRGGGLRRPRRSTQGRRS
jgi:hypothetical protein